MNSTCYEGKFYNISDSKANHEDAKQLCSDNGGQLLTVLDQQKNDFVLRLIIKNSKRTLNKYLKLFFQGDTFWGTFLQLFAVHIQLTIVIGLCMDDGKSLVSRFLRTKMMQFLGRISLSLYLIHDTVIGAIILAINGPQEYETAEQIEVAYDQGDLIVPPGTPVIVIIVSVIVAFIATKYFEEPVSKILKGSK